MLLCGTLRKCSNCKWSSRSFYYTDLKDLKENKRDKYFTQSLEASLSPLFNREKTVAYVVLYFEFEISFGKADAVVDDKADTCFNFFPFKDILFLL